MRIGFYTLGCKLNQFETEALASAVRSKGFSVIEPPEPADIYIVNTCSVTGKSEQKARYAIRNIRRVNPESVIIVTGCYAQVDRKALEKLSDNLIIIPQEKKSGLLAIFANLNDSDFTPQRLDELRERIAAAFGKSDHTGSAAPDSNQGGKAFPSLQPEKGSIRKQPANQLENADGLFRSDSNDEQKAPFSGFRYPFCGGFPPATPPSLLKVKMEDINQTNQTKNNRFAFQVDGYQFHSRASLKIQDGCDSHCSYCIVPLARGDSVSLDPETVLSSIVNLEKKGYREIVLTGVNISSYRYKDVAFSRLVREIRTIVTKSRIRLSSLEPEAIDEDLARALDHPAICPHFHLPVQSGSDRILGLMKRRYTSAKVQEASKLLRTIKPDCFLGCDVIVGFPGETESDFSATRNLLSESGFTAFHVFQFSSRPGTLAAGLTPKIPERIKKERSTDLSSLSGRLLDAYTAQWEGKYVEAILENRIAENNSMPDSWHGVTGNYLKVAISALPEATSSPDGTSVPKDAFLKGRLVRILIDKTGKIPQSHFIAFL